MHDPEGIRTEILLGDGTWVNVSDKVRGADGIRINRGRRDEQGRTATALNLTLEDPDGDFNDLNPLSPYYGLIGPNTNLRVTLGSGPALHDEFTRSVSDAWTGGSFTWSNTGGASTDFDVNGTQGTHTLTDTNVLRYSTANVGQANHRVRASINLSTDDVTGAAASVWILGRMTNTSNYYALLFSNSTVEFLTAQIYVRSGGVLSALGDPFTVDNNAPMLTQNYMGELYIEGSTIRARAWNPVSAEPTEWNQTVIDTTHTTGNLVGVASRRETGNTNANLQARFNEFLAVPGTIRAHVEVPNWGAARWTPGGRDVTMAVQGAGVKRRLGNSSLGSPVQRFMTANDFTFGIAGYWPAEDGATAGQISSGIAGGAPLIATGDGVSFGGSSPFPGTTGMVSLSDTTTLSATVTDTSLSAGSSLYGHMLVTFPEAGLTDGTTIMALFQVQDASIRKWYLQYQSSTGGSLRIVGYDQSFAAAETGAYQTTNLNGQSAVIVWGVTQDGADVDWEIRSYTLLDNGSVAANAGGTGTFTTSSVGVLTAVTVAPAGAMDGCSVGQIAAASTASFTDAEQAASGHFGETAIERFLRLCDEEGIAAEYIGTEWGAPETSSVAMGPQRTGSLLQNLDDIEDAEHGIVYESRSFLGLTLRPFFTLTLQDGPNFTYTDGYLTGEPFPEPDDLLIANDVTASRPDGESRRAVLESGAMSIEDPPNGIGRYARTVSANVSSGQLLADVAGWNLHVGTWRSARYPTIQFDTHRSQFTQTVSDDVDELELGDYFSIDDIPAWLEPDAIKVLMQGYTEEIRNLTRKIVFNCVPAGPYTVASRGFLGTTDVRDSAASTMNSSALAGATSLSVASTGSLWETGAQDFEIIVSGSVLHVTNISGASSPQTFTVDAARVNGVDKALAAGDEVHVYPRPIRSLADTGYLSAGIEAGTDRVTGLDAPPTVWVEGDTTGTFTSATYSAGSEVVGTVFTVPRSGKVMVHIAAEMDNDAAGFTIASFSIRTGPVIGQGTILVTADDTRSILLFATDQMRAGSSFLIDLAATPGSECNIRMEHRRVTLGNASMRRRLLLVRPAGTSGGLPGSNISVYPDSFENEQAASDTSVSTSYTTADMTTCGTSFTAPASGKVLITISARVDNSGANSAYVSFRVGTGTTLNAGTSVVAAADAQALENFNTNQFMCGRAFLVTGLTSGDSYNAVLLHRVTAGTITLENRRISVEPVY